MSRALANPAVHNPVYKVCQRLFHKNDDLVLARNNKLKKMIRRRAFRRFLHGCPPRKKNDTSVGDAFNWEWMVHCATERKAGLVIVSRDSDFGVTLENKSYVNDHLRQEFSDRVSRKRKLLLYTRLSEALKLFQVEVSAQEEAAEQELVSSNVAQSVSRTAEDLLRELFATSASTQKQHAARGIDVIGPLGRKIFALRDVPEPDDEERRE